MMWAKVEAGEVVRRGGRPRVLPRGQGHGGVTNPSDGQLRAAGWLPLVSDPPDPPPGKVVVPDGYQINGNQVRALWRFADEPPPPRDLGAEIDALEARVAALEAQ